MTNSKSTTTAFKTAALAIGISSLVAVSASQAAFVSGLGVPLPMMTPEIGLGILPVAGVNPFGGGTVLADGTSPFSDGFVAGTLRSIVVQNAGGTLDFYYKLTNTNPIDPMFPGDEEIYRLNVLHGFGKEFPGSATMEVGQTYDDPTTVAVEVGGLGIKPASFADRDNGEPGDVAFSFPAGPAAGAGPGADPLNVAGGEMSSFLVVHTAAVAYSSTVAQVSGFGTGTPAAFAPIPEPTSALFGLAMFGVALTSRAKRRASAVA